MIWGSCLNNLLQNPKETYEKGFYIFLKTHVEKTEDMT
jgi:hypothetical protein